jgi:predicted TIM-barrel fold metal-dependent hydrolase
MAWPLITADSHHNVPLDLVDELPAKYRQYLPRIEPREDGAYLVRPRFAAAAKRKKDRKAANQVLDQMTAALSDGIKVDGLDERQLRQMVMGDCGPLASPAPTPEERLVDMAREGVVGEVLIGEGAFGMMLPDDDANLAWCRLANDWMADAYKDHMGQFAPGMLLPLHDLRAAADEVTRAAAMGLRPILLPEVITGMPYSDRMWDPVWEAAAAARVPVFLHLVGGFAGAMFMGIDALPIGEPGGAQTAFAIGSAAGMVTLGWFVNSGVLERHPDLTVALIECNAGWLAYAMQQWDHALHSRYAEIAHRGGVLDADLQAPPSYYVRRQVKCQFMWDPAAVALRHEIGMDVLMWGNDYPHMEGAFPDSQLWVDKQFAGVPHDEIMKIVHDNAADVLGLSV